MVGTQASVTSPRMALPVSRISFKEAASSDSSRRACGKNPSPDRDRATLRVVRSIRRTPRCVSRSLRRRLKALCVMLKRGGRPIEGATLGNGDKGLDTEGVDFHAEYASIMELKSFYSLPGNDAKWRHIGRAEKFMTDSFKSRTTLKVGDRSYEIFQPGGAAAGEGRAPAVLTEDPAGEPAALRGRRQRHAQRHRSGAQLGPESHPGV